MQRRKKPERPAADSPSGAYLLLAALVPAGCTFLLHVLFLHSNMDRDWPFSIFFYGDSQHYHQYAVSLIRGKAYDQGIPYHPPMFAWLLSFLYRWMGIPQTSGFPYKLWMAALNAITTGLMWLWLRRIIGMKWSFIAVAVLMLHFGWMLLSASFNNEALYALCLTATVGLSSLWAKSLPWRVCILLGMIMGVGALTRAENLGLWPFLLLYFWMRRDTDRSILRYHLPRWFFALLVSILCVLPWSIRNAKILNEFNRQTPNLEPLPRVALVTSYGPVNFALANHENADGGFSPDLINRIEIAGMIDLRNESHRKLFVHGYSLGLNWILHHPAAFARLAIRKLNRWTDGLSLGLGVSNWPAGLTGSRPPVDLFVPSKGYLKWPLTLILIVGILLSFRKKWLPLSLCSLIILHRIVITILFFGYARGMIVLLPVIVPLILLPLITLSEKYPKIRQMALILTATLVIVFVGQAIAVVADEPRNYYATGSSDPRTGKIIQDEWVELKPKE